MRRHSPSRRPVLALAVVGLVLLAGCSGTLVGPDGPTTAGGAPSPAPTASGDGASATTTVPTPNGTLSVRFIDVGQGASALVVGPTGETLLMDTGPWQDDGRAVLDALRRANVTRIDHLVTSHADADHIGGHAPVIRHFEEEAGGVGAVYDPGVAAASETYDEYLAAVERYDVPLYRTMAGDTVPLDGATVSVLAPPEDLLEGDRNENSIVLRVAFGRTAFLLTGDAEEAGEAFLVERYGSDLRATVLQAGHHGSRSSSSAALLDAVHPGLVVVSSAYDSPYGHPHRVVLERLAARDVPTVWTGVHGTVVVESDGATVTVLARRAATTEPTRLRDAGPFRGGTGTGLTRLLRFAGDGSATAPPAGGAGTTADGSDGGDEPGRPGDESGPLRLETVHADAVGDDAENLADEYLVFANAGEERLDLSGWTVRDGAGHAYSFPDGTTLEPGETLTLRTGTGTDGPAERHWGSASPVWNNDGDTVIVRSDDGETVVEVTYGGG